MLSLIVLTRPGPWADVSRTRMSVGATPSLTLAASPVPLTRSSIAIRALAASPRTQLAIARTLIITRDGAG